MSAVIAFSGGIVTGKVLLTTGRYLTERLAGRKPAPSGLVRPGRPAHRCKVGPNPTVNQIWRCSCGRRWKCVRQAGIFYRAAWTRYRWPWPRRVVATATERNPS